MKHRLRSLDPLLGFAYSMEDLPVSVSEKKIPGFVIIDDENDVDREKLKIVTLGGSTTSPYFEHNWPKAFKTLLDKQGIASIIYNGGVNGYSTNQELLKFIRDVLPLKPDIVISLNGINDLGFIHSIRKHPMIHPYSNFVLKSILKKGIISKQKDDAVNNINLGPSIESTPVQQWERNLRIVNSLAVEFSIKYMSFLQPTLGIGGYKSNEKEGKMLQEYIDNMNPRYLQEVENFYIGARKKTEKYSYMKDIVDIFAGKENLYYNARHPNAKGYSIIANKIFNTLKSIKWI